MAPMDSFAWRPPAHFGTCLARVESKGRPAASMGVFSRGHPNYSAHLHADRAPQRAQRTRAR
eukprot:2968096-Pyramimonas_sp.AAC.1